MMELFFSKYGLVVFNPSFGTITMNSAGATRVRGGYEHYKAVVSSLDGY